MKDIFDAEIAAKAIKKAYGAKPECPRRDMEECLTLLRKKEALRNQVLEIEQQVAALQREIEFSSMYVLYGTEYCCFLSALNEWRQENGMETH